MDTRPQKDNEKNQEKTFPVLQSSNAGPKKEEKKNVI
jgi:hypothetical protein